MPFRPPRVLAVTVMAFAATFTSCSDSPLPAHTAASTTQSSKQATTHGPADVAFARNMIPHHQQAVVLAAMVPSHSANTALRVMATHIGAGQLAEIRTLEGLFAEWEEPVDPGGMTSSHHEAMSMPGMAGMVDRATLDRLEILDDDAFDTLWVRSMIGHHQGAITMAREEIAHGQSADAIHVAELIIAAQQREIAMMNHLISASQ